MYKQAKFIRHEHLNKFFWKIFIIYNVNNDNNEVCSGNSDEN